MRGSPSTPHPTENCQPRKIDYPFLKDETIRFFALDAKLARIAANFLGRAAYLIRDQLFMKPPRIGTAKPLHQENAALLFDPPDHMLITWVALDDATPDNGCLRFIDGSHHTLLDHEPIPDARFHLIPRAPQHDPREETEVPVHRGSVIVIHSQTLHASGINRSDTWRRAYSCHWVTDQVRCGTDALKYGYSRTVGSERYTHRSP